MRAFVAGMLFAAVIAVAMGADSKTWGLWDENQMWVVIVADSIDIRGIPQSKKWGNSVGDCVGWEPYCVDNGKIYLRRPDGF